MKKRVLITGISGFVGSYLAEYLISKKAYLISGTYLSNSSLQNIKHIENKLHLIQIDLTNEKKVFDFVKSLKPDFIFHLAALSSPAYSFEHPKEPLINNISAQISILEAVRKAKLKESRLLIISSADVYGAVAKKDLPIDEETPFRPTNPYGVSKITQDFLGLQYYLSYKLKIVRVRPFNHIGPKQSSDFVVSAFAKKIAEIEKKEREGTLLVGNLEAKRDLTDVRDIVRAYSLIIEKGKIGDVYNLGAGASHKIADILEQLLRFSKTKIKVASDPFLFRPVDTPELVCNNRKIRQVIDWKPTISIKQTLKDTLDYWRNIV